MENYRDDWPSVDGERVAQMMLKIIQNELTYVERRLLFLRFARGMRVTDIAKEFNVNKSAVSRALFRAQERIARFMKYTCL